MDECKECVQVWYFETNCKKINWWLFYMQITHIGIVMISRIYYDSTAYTKNPIWRLLYHRWEKSVHWMIRFFFFLQTASMTTLFQNERFGVHLLWKSVRYFSKRTKLIYLYFVIHYQFIRPPSNDGDCCNPGGQKPSLHGPTVRPVYSGCFCARWRRSFYRSRVPSGTTYSILPRIDHTDHRQYTHAKNAIRPPHAYSSYIIK